MRKCSFPHAALLPLTLPSQPAPLSFIISLICLLIDPICVSVSLIHLHLLPCSLPAHPVLLLWGIPFPLSFFYFLKGTASTSSYTGIFSFIPNFTSKQQQGLKSYPSHHPTPTPPPTPLIHFTCQHIHLIIRTPSWENQPETSPPTTPPRGRLFP